MDSTPLDCGTIMASFRNECPRPISLHRKWNTGICTRGSWFLWLLVGEGHTLYQGAHLEHDVSPRRPHTWLADDTRKLLRQDAHVLIGSVLILSCGLDIGCGSDAHDARVGPAISFRKSVGLFELLPVLQYFVVVGCGCGQSLWPSAKPLRIPTKTA